MRSNQGIIMSKNLQSIKSESEVDLAGVKITFVKEDKAIKSVVITDGYGGVLILKAGDYSNTIKPFIPAPPEQVERWELSGNFIGVKEVSELFDTEWDAKKRLNEFEAFAPRDSGLTIQKVMIDLPGETAAEADGIPF